MFILIRLKGRDGRQACVQADRILTVVDDMTEGCRVHIELSDGNVTSLDSTQRAIDIFTTIISRGFEERHREGAHAITDNQVTP